MKQLLNRNSQLLRLGNTADWVSNKSMTISPYFSSGISMNATTGALTNSAFGGDVYSFLAPMYIYMRGSVRLALVQDEPVETGGSAAASSHFLVMNTPAALDGTTSLNPYDYGLVSNGTNAPLPGLAGATANSWPLVSPNPNDLHVGISYYEFPYYNKYPISHPAISAGIHNFPFTDPTYPSTCATFTQNTNFDVSTTFYRSFSDNFVLSHFIGCPPLLGAYV